MANSGRDLAAALPGTITPGSLSPQSAAPQPVGAGRVDAPGVVAGVQPDAAAAGINAATESKSVRAFRAVPLVYDPDGPHNAWMPDLRQQMITHELNCLINTLRRGFNMTVPQELLEEFRAMPPHVQRSCLSPPCIMVMSKTPLNVCGAACSMADRSRGNMLISTARVAMRMRVAAARDLVPRGTVRTSVQSLHVDSQSGGLQGPALNAELNSQQNISGLFPWALLRVYSAARALLGQC